MTITELHAYFDLLTDKAGSPYFTADEKDSFISQAQIEFVKRTLPSNENGIVNLEMSSIVFNNISTLVYETAGLNSNSSGEITTSAIQTALNTASGSTEPYMYVMNVSYNGYPCRFTRHNDWYTYAQNTFKTGAATSPRYRQMGTKFGFSPVNQTASVKFTLLKQPKDVDLGTNVTSELPSHTHKTLVELAVDLASVSMRDDQLQAQNSTQLNS